MGRLNELRLIARVAQMYHIEGKRQAEIAETMRMSQATVSRMLKRAEQEDIVRTTVIPPAGTFADLETALRERYGLTEAIVIDCSEDRDGAIMARIGEAAAHFLEVTLQQDEIVGVSSWSQTILRMVDNIHPLKTAKAKYIVQILGGMGDASVQTHATQLTARLARLTGGEPRLLLVQGITSSREAKLVMLADPVVRETMDLFGRLSLAIVGIGAVEPSELLARSGNIFSRQEMSMLHEAGAVGEISYRFYDKDGKPVETPLNERVIGISLEDLRKTDRVMALAGGESKTQAIAGALNLGVIDVLVTDKFTAARLTA
ncbi:sugar-binding transcriptional regulator [Sinorhizobium meliloti]|uniref:sugar-binding transcriptional regulator n=1 Tax=Rhizobium meliloti TaxID=382 RepID=UPI000EFADDCA|nr:sugar-binding transcriptional regulator [Sinorhizobium meliloti]MCO5962511.1 sugar-binding transcriptional regulator [Sinorhizobium meliloti]MDW9451320.1 sugar-binding transcriptional regulator [Sinorhizobium meliloti]MDW9552698.1 sugar-binding transcriptional regulator [Sinorhizobium meliloti]MDW9621689.1 sugar-binding transcriptional regulator [Sinorhizobium meliloti]MDW9664252.1 sugar-binding transcriptional regulator [Sinorhizobium meliloti]